MLLAKPDQSLFRHSYDACRALDQLAKSSLPVWKRRLQDLGYQIQDLEDILYYMVACHDLGKAMAPWQRYIRGQGPRTYHSLFSMVLARGRWPKSHDVMTMAALLAILSHHAQLHKNSSQDANTAALGQVEFDKDKLNLVLAELGELEPLEIGSLTGFHSAKCVADLIQIVDKMKPPEKIRFKALFCLFHTILRLADNEASAKNENKGGLIHEFSRALDGFATSMPSTDPNEIQRMVVGQAPWLVLRAGCGVGKTGAALAFAMEHINAGRADRVILTLPTQFTTNSMYWDLTPKYNIPPDLRGIYHSEIEGVLKLEADDADDDFVRTQKYQNTFYNKPVTVSTVDHLLYSLLHCNKYSDRAFGNIFTSVVVFDEIHFYDNFTLNKIGQCLEFLRNLHIPHLIMTATMPQVVLDRLQKQTRDGYAVITQREEVPARPFTVAKASNPMLIEDNISNELLELVRKNIGCKQMLVVNRVDLAKNLARALQKEFPKSNIICYHSQFCRRDRTKKEQLIKILFTAKKRRSKGQQRLLASCNLKNCEEVILVSTQVCELSLDISADVMYSMIAPVDSVIQRGGRLHRRGRLPQLQNCGCQGCTERRYLSSRHQYKLYLFPLTWDNEGDFFPYGLPEQHQCILSSWDVIQGDYSFEAGTKWVDAVFTVAPLLIDSDMKTMVIEDVVFGRTPSERYGDEDSQASQGSFRVRDFQQSTLTVIPACYEKEAVNLDKAYMELGVKISPWLFRKYGRKEGQLWLLDLPYSPEFGFEYERRKSSSKK